MKKIVKPIVVLMTIFVFLFPKSVYAATGSEIVLDGYFDDWVNKPSTTIKYGWQNPGQYSTVKWYCDNENLYLYIKMGEVGYSSMSNNMIEYWIDGAQMPDIQLSLDTPAKGRTSIYNYSYDYRPFSADGYIVRGGTNGIKGDQAEFRIPLTLFQKSSKNQMLDLKMRFPDLGDQYIEFQVGSTKPYLGIAVSGIAAASGFIIYKRRKRRVLA
ncbi:Firmicu-CTERM sorting domain-containing protein [Clostridium neuense]|uniref:Firmicu-CTERM sorting domain-containing protein n=1 Tax=Clostridium neuense TaxID=1728934 RepID=A0ABW8TE46_9CLOT